MMPPRKCFVHEVTPGVAEKMTLVTALPDGPHASLRSSWAGQWKRSHLSRPLCPSSPLQSVCSHCQPSLWAWSMTQKNSPERTTGYSILGWELVSHSFL